MKKAFLVVAASLLALYATAQSGSLPGMASPQPAAFQPIGLPGDHSTTGNYRAAGRSYPQSALPASYQADLRRTVQQHRQAEALREEIQETFSKPHISYTLPSHTAEPGAGCYLQAFRALNDMLAGRSPISLKQAVFLVENAYLNNQMSYEAFDQRIRNYAQFCRLKMQEEKADTANNAVKNDMLFRLLSDTLTVIDPATKKKVTHYPVHYDFDDFYGQKDWTKMFVTKLMNTNYGQCHSMPLLYVIIAEELGAAAFLSTSPSHLFIKYRRGNEWKNVELTNGHMTTDAWLMASGYIKSEALKSRIYLDTLSRRKEIALMMQDLAKGYYIKYGFDGFAAQCINTGLRYYPNDAYGMGLKSDYSTVLFRYVVSQKPGQTPQQVLTDPQAMQLYKAMHAVYDALDNAGYAQMPEAAYEDWLRSID